MESLIDDFFKFPCAIAELLFLEQRLAMPTLNFEIFLKFPYFLKS